MIIIFNKLLSVIQELLKSVKRKVDRCEKMLQCLIDTINVGGDGASFTASAEPVNSEFIINGKKNMRIPATGPYNFGFQLLDMLFTKDELSKSLLRKTPRSSKLALDEEKVQRLLYLVEKRYSDRSDWNEKTLISKLNQKCHDSAPKSAKQETYTLDED